MTLLEITILFNWDTHPYAMDNCKLGVVFRDIVKLDHVHELTKNHSVLYMILLSMVLLFFMYITTILFHHSVSLDWRSEIKRIPVESHLFFETDLIKILLDFTVHSRKVVSWFRMSFFPTVRRPLDSLSVYLVACDLHYLLAGACGIYIYFATLDFLLL